MPYSIVPQGANGAMTPQATQLAYGIAANMLQSPLEKAEAAASVKLVAEVAEQTGSMMRVTVAEGKADLAMSYRERFQALRLKALDVLPADDPLELRMNKAAVEGYEALIDSLK